MDRTEKGRILAALYDALRRRQEPASLADLTAAVEVSAPLRAPVKDLRGLVRRALAGLGAIRLDDRRWVLPEIALEGARFRCTPQPVELKRGRLYVASRFSPFLPLYPGPRSAWRLIDSVGGQVATVDLKDAPSCAVDLTGWYRARDFSADDSILVSVSYRGGLAFRLAHEPLSRRDPSIAARTRAFADATADLLAGWGREEAPLASLVRAVLVRHPVLLQSPPQDYRDLFARDGRFRLLEGGAVSSADYRRPIDYLHLFPTWGRGSLEAMSPGYAVPPEGIERGPAESAGHWLRLISIEVANLDLAARRATVRVHADSSAGPFQSDLELTLAARAPLARSFLARLRSRFRLIVAGQAPDRHGGSGAPLIAIENEAQAYSQIAELLRGLSTAAGDPVAAANLSSLGRTRLEFTGPQAS